MIENTSLLAYIKVIENLGERQEQVYKAIAGFGECSNTMISNRLHLPINCITPRVNELRKKNLVREAYKGTCPFTDKKVLFWKVAHKLA